MGFLARGLPPSIPLISWGSGALPRYGMRRLGVRLGRLIPGRVQEWRERNTGMGVHPEWSTGLWSRGPRTCFSLIFTCRSTITSSGLLAKCYALKGVEVVIIPRSGYSIVYGSVTGSFTVFYAGCGPVPIRQLGGLPTSPIGPLSGAGNESSTNVPIPLSLASEMVYPLSKLSIARG